MAHYFKIQRDGIKGIVTVNGKVADLDKFVKDSTKRMGLTVEELSQDDAEKERNRLEV